MKKIVVFLTFILLLYSMILVLPVNAAINGKIAFSSARDNSNNEIYIMNPDGTNPSRITNNDVRDDFPVWSPDGTKIAFISDNNVYVMNVDGSNPIQVTDYSDPLISTQTPTWSPDGKKIAFTWIRYSQDTGNSIQIYVVDAIPGSTPIHLTSGNDYHHFSPAWSPDGSKIAFELGAGENSGIYVMDTDGSNPKSLTNGPDRMPAWSPDGTKIAFISDNNVYVMTSNGYNPTPLTQYLYPNFAQTPTWSPDGTKIAFTANPDGNYKIYVMDSDGTDVTSITENTYPNLDPSWGRGIITILAPDSGFVGGAINLTGINTLSAKTYLYLSGPNLEPKEVLIGVADVSLNNEWFYNWMTASNPGGTLNPGTYTIYASGTTIDQSSPDTYVMASMILKKPADGVQDLRNKVDGMGLPLDIEKGLLNKLMTAQIQITQKKNTPARNVLSAFINQINAQRGKALTVPQANELIMNTQQIINAIPGK